MRRLVSPRQRDCMPGCRSGRARCRHRESSLSWVVLLCCKKRSTDNTRLIEAGSSNKWGACGQAVVKFRQFGCGTTAQDEQVGGEEKLEASQILVKTLTPTPPR